MVSEKDLESFKKLYKKTFNKEISDQDASDKATKLLRLIQIIYKPISKKQYERLQKRRKELGEIK